MAAIDPSGAVRAHPARLEGTAGREIGNLEATYTELTCLFGPDDCVQDAAPMWVILVESTGTRAAERISLHARGTAPRDDPARVHWWGLGASRSGGWAADRVAETIRRHRQSPPRPRLRGGA